MISPWENTWGDMKGTEQHVIKLKIKKPGRVDCGGRVFEAGGEPGEGRPGEESEHDQRVAVNSAQPET